MGEGFYVLLAIAVGLYLLVGPGLGIAAFFRSDRGAALQFPVLLKRIDAQSAELAALRRLLEERGEGPDPAVPPAETGPVAEAEDEAGPEAPAPQPARATSPEVLHGPQETDSSGAPDKPQAPKTPQDQAPPPGGRSIEEWLTSRGLIWLGGVTLALAGLFLAKYGYERGWLAMGPGARVTAGFLFGAALTGAGEWLRRRPLQQAIAAIGPNYLPPALTAAGLSSAFASVYAAYALYALLPPLLAFALMALVAFAAFGLALLQGPFIAVLALLGGFVTPLLVASPEPSAWGLFSYLLFLSAAALGVVRYMACWWLAWGALTGAALWALFWFGALWSPQDAPALGSYLVLLAGLFLAIRYRAKDASAMPGTLPTPDLIGWAGAVTVAVLMFALVRMDAYGPASLTALFLLACLYLAAAWQDAVFEALVPFGAALAATLITLWYLPAIADWPEYLHSYRGEDYGSALGPVVPPQLGAFVAVSLAFGALYGAVGFAAVCRGRDHVVRAEFWAGTSAALPVLLLAVAYWRVTGLGIDLAWSAVALAIAGLEVAAAMQLRRRPQSGAGNTDLLIGIYALGCIAALSLAMAMALEEAWLTVALSLQLPALAWISTRLDLRPLRPVALLIAAVVLVRLVVNYNILSYPLGTLPAFNWILYGYGLPALAFWWSARRFRQALNHGQAGNDGKDDRLVLVLEGGSMVLLWLLVTYEIRSLVVGDLGSRSYDLAEQSLQTVAWLGIAYAWLRAYRRSGRAALLWGWRLLAGLAALHSPLFQLLLSNPLWSGDPVGNWPLVNLLALAYLVPGGFALAFARELRRSGHRQAAMAAAVYALLLIFTYLSLEVRRAFHGPVLSLGPTGDGELLSYTLAWLGYAWVLLALGVRSGYASLRYASLAVLGVATAKVLFFDWGTLEGLARFCAFAALGSSLLGIPFLYQKRVFPPAGPGPKPEAAYGPEPPPGPEAAAASSTVSPSQS
jgi:uncharacterized membrane protein